MKQTYYFFLALFAFCVSCQGDNTPDPDGLSPELRKVSNLIASAGELQTEKDKNEIEIVKTDTLPGIIPDYRDPYYSRGSGSGGTYFEAQCVERTTKYDMVDSPKEFVTLDPLSNIWPGALIQGSSLTKGTPTLIPIYEKRKPGRISLSMVSSNEDMDEWYSEVPMQESDVTQAVNELMAKHIGNSIPMHTTFKIKTVHSVEDMALKLGINFKLFDSKLSTEFGQNWDPNKSYVAVKIDQLFFRIAYEAPEGGFRGIFTDDIRTGDLENHTGFGNPICYVGSISYGRSFVLLYESDSSSAALEVAVNVGCRYYNRYLYYGDELEVFNASTCKMIQIGGIPEQGLKTTFEDFEQLRKFMKISTISKDKVGAPISYTIHHVKDNSYARLSNMLKYEANTKSYCSAQLFLNYVTIDVQSLQTTPPRPLDKKFYVSNRSSIKIKSIKLVHLSQDNGISFSSLLDNESTDREQRGNKWGNNISVSGFGDSKPSDDKHRYVRLECLVEVHNEIYRDIRKKETREVMLTRTFEWTQDGQWRAVADGNTSAADSFTSIKRSETIADANIDLDFKFRFMLNGAVLE